VVESGVVVRVVEPEIGRLWGAGPMGDESEWNALKARPRFDLKHGIIYTGWAKTNGASLLPRA